MDNKSNNNNNSEKSLIINGSMVEQQDKIVGDKENTNPSLVANSQGMKNEGHAIDEQEQNKPSSPKENHLAIRTIKQENLALNSIETPTDLPSDTDPHISTIKNESMEDEKLKYSAKLAEMRGVKEENERLKLLLAQILKDYQSLQSHFLDILKHQEANPNNEELDLNPKDDHDHDQLLVSLSLGRTSPNSDNNELAKSIVSKITSGNESNVKDHREGFDDKLALALGSSTLSHDIVATTSNHVNLSSDNNNNNNNHNSFDESKEVVDQGTETTEVWPPSKSLKAARPNSDDNGDGDNNNNEDGVSQMSPLKKARVSVRTRCDTPTMNDGCQWRKYGQKISKGNPCPRAYYRCTVSPSCPVRKQVQRCVEDMSILVTTYEGTHNHPLPISATAMASTTAAAASMLQSRSTASSQLATASATSAPLSIQNYSLINNNRQSLSSSSSNLYLPNTTFSTYNSHPTVTLDLTLPNPNSSSSSSSLPRFPSTCLSFSSSSSPSLEVPNFMNPNNSYLNNYGKLMTYQSRNYQIGSYHHQQQQPLAVANNQASSNLLYQPYNINNILSGGSNQNDNQQSMMTETIAAATKAITSNPKFQSALAAALTSFVGKDGGISGSGSGV